MRALTRSPRPTQKMHSNQRRRPRHRSRQHRAAVELRHNGSIAVEGTGIAPLPEGAPQDGEVADPEALGDALKDLFTEQKLPQVRRVGIANQRVVVRTLRMPAIANAGELETAIRFQAQDHIPMSLEDAVLDWQVLEPDAELRQQRTDRRRRRRRPPRNRPEPDRRRSSAGLKPVGIDVSAFAMIRALADEAPTAQMPSYEERGPETDVLEIHQPARLLCHFGDIINLAVARGSNCLFTRASQFGLEGIVQTLSESRGPDPRARARVAAPRRPSASGRGDRRRSARRSPRPATRSSRASPSWPVSFASRSTTTAPRRTAVAIEEIVVCGAGSAIEGVDGQVQAELGYAAASRPAPWPSHSFDPRHAARLTLPLGLALED